MQYAASSPSGARCALHGDRAASLVCGRCGNFMCVECSEGGEQTQCPKCRDLTGVSSFPLSRDRYDIGSVWNLCWSSFQREWLMLCVCSVIVFGMLLVGSAISSIISSLILRAAGFGGRDMSLKGIAIGVVVSQSVSLVLNLAIQGVAMVGFYRVLMDVLLGRRCDVARMFNQLRKLPTYALAQLLLFLVVWLPSVLYFALLVVLALAVSGVSPTELGAVGADRLFHGPSIGIFVGGMLLYFLVFSVAVLPLTLFVVPEIVVSDCGAVEALKRAWRIGSGHRFPMIGYSIVAGLVILLSLLLCLVPVLAGLPLGLSLLIALFLAARNGADVPAPDHS